jgi:uncharacterized protein YeaO (DUF488 family)
MTQPTTKRPAARPRISIKRAYAAPEPTDGIRVLVDGLWPRGLRKESAGIDLWLKEIAPSPKLRRWFHHDPARWSEFQRRYRDELSGKEASIDQLLKLAGKGYLTLLFASADTEHNNAVVLESVLRKRGAARS